MGPLTVAQSIVFGTLVLTLVLFVWGRWRYDVVSLLALLAVTVAGIVPASEAFTGFGHPAVVTVAAVLVVSRGLMNSGLVDLIAGVVSRVGDQPTVQVAALTGVVAVASAFMNNVGALALLMPVAIRVALKSKNSPSLLLMPLAFGSLLGGLITMIGTPPNIIIATFRAENDGAPFRMFDFTPVGAGVALVGAFFITLVGWRLIPLREGQASREAMFHIEDYLTEVRLPDDSKMVGKALRNLEQITDAEVAVLGLVRGQQRVLAPSSFETLRSGDILIVEADSDALKALIDAARLELVGSKDLGEEALKSDEVSVVEAIVKPDSLMVGRTARALQLRWRYGVNLLAVARQGARLKERLGMIRFQIGDVLLLQGRADTIQAALSTLGCLPLAGRDVRLGQPRRVVLAVGVFGLALAAAAAGLLPVQVAFSSGAVVMVLAGLLSLREAYESIDWPVIVLLGAMIPVGYALETTGGAELIAGKLLGIAGHLPAAATLAVVLVGTMLLSNVVNNAAAAVVMAPIGISIARGLEASLDPFLMAVAVGASCAFLTPIGHQSNTLVLGPGGYRFGDYWWMGLPLSCLVAALAVPLILYFWPLEMGTP